LINIKGREKPKERKERIWNWKREPEVEEKEENQGKIEEREENLWKQVFFLFLKNIGHASCFNVFFNIKKFKV